MKSGRDRINMTGRALLVGDQPEAPGYGLYSYVLFESEPTAETKPIYLAVISACLEEIQDLGELDKTYRPKTLNAMWIPVKSLPVRVSDHEGLQSKAEKILDLYNYARAQAILDQLYKARNNGGPYLASSLSPVSSSSKTSSVLFQDLSVVRQVSNQGDQTNMAYEWVLDFVGRVSNPRPKEQDWNDASLESFVNEVRDTRQPAFKRYGVRADQLDLKRYIVFPIPDSKVERTLPFPSWHTRGDNSGSDLRKALDQSFSIPRLASSQSQTSPVRQREEACDGQCPARE
ncbi:MAG: hypothetical protein MRJ66_10005 [Nitrospira sp.]|nr:hypothetical protein [Nitrospira sp.]